MLNKTKNTSYFKNSIPIVLFLFIILTISACESKQVAEDRGVKYGGKVRINTSAYPDIIFPGHVMKKSEQLIINQVYDGLVKYHPRTLEIVPALSRNWLVERNGTIYTFYIRKGAKFHEDPCFEQDDSRLITAHDVKYSIEQICKLHLIAGHEMSSQIMNIKDSEQFLVQDLPSDTISIPGIEVFDDTTLIFYLKKEDPMFIHFLAGSNSLVFSEQAFEEYGIKSTVGSGAFTFNYPKSVGDGMILKANTEYYGMNKQLEKLPFIDTLEVSFIISTSRELEMMSANNLDIILGLTEKYIAPFLDSHIDEFQSNPPFFTLNQTKDFKNEVRYNILRSNIYGIEINSQGYFDFSETYLKEPSVENVEMVE